MIELEGVISLATSMAQPARLKRCIMIEGGRCNKTPWIVAENAVDGLEMITLSKTDSGFSRFVAGSNKGINKMEFLDQLRKMRTQATIDACNGDSLFDTHSIAQSRHFKAQKESWKDNGAVPRTISVVLPAAEEFQAESIQVQASLDVRSNVSVVLNVAVLDHIAACMRQSEKQQSKRQQPLGNGVRWSSSRNCYIATRANKRMRLFRANGEQGDDDARQDALDWAAKQEDTDDSTGDEKHDDDEAGGVVQKVV